MPRSARRPNGNGAEAARLGAPDVRLFTAPNGMRVALVPDDRSPAAAFYMWVRVGSADEKDDEAGLAHVLEHMLFKGTETRGVGQIAQEVEGCGGEINAYTSFDTTVYYAVMASRFFDTGLDVIVDATLRSTIDEKELALEREVILEEIRRDQDQPGRKVSHSLFRQAYTKHPYGRPVIGYPKLVSAYDRPTVSGFWKKWYVPSNMLLVVAGNFDPAQARAKVTRALARIPAGRPPRRARAVEPAQKRFRGEAIAEDVSEVHFEAGFHIPGLASPDVPALDVLAIALGQGDRSRLPWRVRRGKRLATGISSYAYTPSDPGLFFVSASFPVEHAKEGAHEALRETFRLLREPVTEEELDRARVSIEGDAVYERETVQGTARKVGFYEAVGGGLATEKKYFEAIRSLTPADLARVAETYLAPSNLTVTMLGPADSLPKMEDVSREAKRSFDEFTRASAKAARAAKKSATRVKAGERESRVVLPGGATLLVRRDPAVPLLAVRGVFLGGLRFETDETAGMTHLLARVLPKGTSDRSFAEIVRVVDRFAGGVSGFSGFNSFGLRLDALSRHRAEAIELFCDILQRPSFEEREIEHERIQVLEAIKSLEDHPGSWVMRVLTQALYRKHPYRLSMIGEADRISKVGSTTLADFYGQIAVPGNLSIAVVGDVYPEEMVERFSEGLAGFGGGRTFEMPAVEREPAITAPREAVVYKDKEQAHIALGFHGFTFHDRERHALELISAALSGQGGRLFLELRDKQALAYQVTAFTQEAFDPGYFCVYMATDPKKLTKAVDGIRLELEKIRRAGLTESELERNKRQLVGGFEIDLQRAAARAANLAFNDRYGIGYRDYLDYPKRVLAVTRDQIMDVARRVLDPEKSALAIVRPPDSAS